MRFFLSLFLSLFFFSFFFAAVEEVNEELACKKNSDCVAGDGCFENKCVHTELVINGSESKYVSFSGETQKEETVYWTFFNASSNPLIIVDLTPLNCSTLASCKVLPVKNAFLSSKVNDLFFDKSDVFVPVQQLNDPASSADWKYLDVDSSQLSGVYNSIVLDEKNRVHASYFDVSNNFVRYAFFDGSNWRIENVARAKPGEFGTYTSIDVFQDKVGIVFRDSEKNALFYALKNGSSWSLETVAEPDSQGFVVGERASLAFDEKGVPFVVYVNRFCSDSCKSFLVVAKKEKGNWVKTGVDSYASSGGIDFPSIDFSEQGTVFVSYAFGAVNSKELKIARFNGSWIKETVYSGKNVAFTSIKALSKPHIAFFDSVSDTESGVFYSVFSNGSWETKTIESGRDLGYFTVLGLSSDEVPSILYFDRFNKKSRIATKTDVGWRILTVASPAFVSDGLQSLAVGRKGFFHALFVWRKNPLNTGSAILRYAVNSPKAFIVTDPDPAIGTAPFTVKFEGFTDVPFDSVEFVWSFNDGNKVSSARGQTVFFTFNNQGENFATLSVINKDTGVEYGRNEAKIIVSGVKKKGLTAVASVSPKEGFVPFKVSVDASNSFSTDSVIVSYSWEIKRISDQKIVFSSSRIKDVFDLNTPGEYILKLVVKDDKERQDTVIVSIKAKSSTDFKARISTTPLVPSGSAPLLVDFNALGSDVPSAMLNVKYEWDLHEAGAGKFFSPFLTYTFTEPGVYEVFLKLSGDMEVLDPNNPGEKILQHFEDTASVVIAVLSDKSFVLEPWSSRIVKEKIVFFPSSAPYFLKPGLEAKYTDSKIVGKKTKRVEDALVFSVVRKDSADLGVLLKAGEENLCVGYNGLTGVTGENVFPKVLFSWNWKDIGINACDAGTDKEYIFCDPTQFSIELAYKLDRINSFYAQNNDGEASKLLRFEAFLIKDNFSEDFQKDFAFYYTNTFLPVPFFASSATPWHKFFSDPSRLSFEPRELPGPGLYTVTLDFDFDVQQNMFFLNSEPAAKIRVRFEPKALVGSSFWDSPFYYLPFNGLVGTLRRDESGKIERNGYGLGFVVNGKPVNLVSSVEQSYSLPSIKGNEFFTVSSSSDLLSLNKGENKGVVLSIDALNKQIVFHPSFLVPIAMYLPSVKGVAEAFYSVYKSNQLIVPDKESNGFLEWTAVGSSPFPNNFYCKNFDGSKLFSFVQDKKAGQDSCAFLEGRPDSLGLRFAPAPEEKKLLAVTTFFVPLDEDLLLRSSCSENGVFATKSDVSTGFNEAISLRQSGIRMSSLQDLINFIKKEKICMSVEPKKTVFFWNLKKALFEDSLPALNHLGEVKNFNFENYACEVSLK